MEERNTIYKIIEYGKIHEEFTPNELKMHLELSENEFYYLKKVLWHQRSIYQNNSNHIIVTSDTSFSSTIDQVMMLSAGCCLLHYFNMMTTWN